MQIYGNTIVQDGSTRFAARCSLFLIVSITYYWHDIDVRYSIMYYIYIIAKHIVNTSEGSKKVGFGVVWYHRSWGYIALNQSSGYWGCQDVAKDQSPSPSFCSEAVQELGLKMIYPLVN